MSSTILVFALVFSLNQSAKAGSIRLAPGTAPMPTYRFAAAPNLPPISDANIDAHISTTLVPAERQLMHNLMLQLPPNRRYNVVYHTLDGKVHSNNPALLKDFKVYHASVLHPDLGTAADGSSFGVVPDHSISPLTYNCRSIATFPNSGPYRQIYSTCNTPYVFSYAYLPCNNTMAFRTALDTPFIYEGGYSSTGNAIDAGLQFSYANNNWALFVSGSHGFLANGNRLQCNQTLWIEFNPTSTTILTVDSYGYLTSGLTYFVSQNYQVLASDGWSPSCGGCVVKRITSLGQKIGYQTFNNGSYFGVDAFGAPLVHWGNTTYVGFWTGSIPAKYNVYTWTASYTGGYTNYPNDSSRVVVNYHSPAEEIDGINLHF